MLGNLFEEFRLSFQRAESSLFKHPALVVRIGEQYYKWSAACPIIMSTILYGRTLPSDLVEVIRGSYQEPKRSLDDKMSLSTSPNPAQKKHSTSWWPFSSRREEEEEKRDATTASATAPASAATVTASHDLTPVPEVPPPVVPLEAPKTPKPEDKEPASAPKLTTRYSVGTQTTFLNDAVLLLDRDDNEPEASPQAAGNEKFRKTLRLSNDAIVSCLMLPTCLVY